jgi:hypothetical protein
MRYFVIEHDMEVPKVQHDFMGKYRYKILRAFRQMKDGDSIILPFHPSLIYPICNGNSVNIITRQVSINSWRYWTKERHYDKGTEVTILDCYFNKVNRGDKGKIVEKMPNGYSVEVTNDEDTFTVFVESHNII